MTAAASFAPPTLSRTGPDQICLALTTETQPWANWLKLNQKTYVINSVAECIKLIDYVSNTEHPQSVQKLLSKFTVLDFKIKNSKPWTSTAREIYNELHPIKPLKGKTGSPPSTSAVPASNEFENLSSNGTSNSTSSPTGAAPMSLVSSTAASPMVITPVAGSPSASNAMASSSSGPASLNAGSSVSTLLPSTGVALNESLQKSTAWMTIPNIPTLVRSLSEALFNRQYNKFAAIAEFNHWPTHSDLDHLYLSYLDKLLTSSPIDISEKTLKEAEAIVKKLADEPSRRKYEERCHGIRKINEQYKKLQHDLSTAVPHSPEHAVQSSAGVQKRAVAQKVTSLFQDICAEAFSSTEPHQAIMVFDTALSTLAHLAPVLSKGAEMASVVK